MNSIEKAARDVQGRVRVQENAYLIYHHFAESLISYFGTRGFGSATAEDLAQEVFTRLFRSLDKFRFEAEFETWVFMIAKRVHQNAMRDSRALKRLGDEIPIDDLIRDDVAALPSTDDIVDPFGDPLGSVLSSERTTLLKEAISLLPPRMAECANMRVNHGLSIRDIASIMGVSRATVYAHLRNARQRIAESFSEGLKLSEVDEAAPIVTGLIQVCSAELMNWLARHPEDLYRVHPGTFEKIIAEIFEAEGFEVELVSSWNQPDGGVDLIALKKLAVHMQIKLAVQCKRHTRTRHVSAEPVRSLAAVLDRFKAHAGVVATTSFFTDEAREETERYFWRVGLRDYDQIVSSLQSFAGFRTTESGLWVPELSRQEGGGKAALEN